MLAFGKWQSVILSQSVFLALIWWRDTFCFKSLLPLFHTLASLVEQLQKKTLVNHIMLGELQEGKPELVDPPHSFFKGNDCLALLS